MRVYIPIEKGENTIFGTISSTLYPWRIINCNVIHFMKYHNVSLYVRKIKFQLCIINSIWSSPLEQYMYLIADRIHFKEVSRELTYCILIYN